MCRGALWALAALSATGVSAAATAATPHGGARSARRSVISGGADARALAAGPPTSSPPAHGTPAACWAASSGDIDARNSSGALVAVLDCDIDLASAGGFSTYFSGASDVPTSVSLSGSCLRRCAPGWVCDGPVSGDSWRTLLAPPLSSVPRLTDLNVSHCDFRNALALGHGRIDTVVSLDISYNDRFTDGPGELCAAFPNLRVIVMRYMTWYGGGASLSRPILDGRLKQSQASSFSNCRRLAELNMAVGTLVQVALLTRDPGSNSLFAGLSRLQSLILDDNSLTELPANLFEDTTALQVLSLWCNPLSRLPSGIFDALSQLTHLNLAANRLVTLPNALFANTTRLELLNLGARRTSPSALTEKDIGVWRHRLDNQIGDPVDEADSFMNTGVLTGGSGCDFGNRLTELPEGIFAGLVSLEQLLLDHMCTLTSVHAGTFDDLVELKFLDLTGTANVSILDGMLSALKRLDTLSLRGQQADWTQQAQGRGILRPGRTIQPAIWSSAPGGGDGGTSLGCAALRGLSGLRKLVLAGNQLRRILRSFFAGLTSLKILDLCQSAIWILDTGIFDDLTALQTLLLSSNAITTAAAGWAPANLAWLYWGAGSPGSTSATVPCGYPDGVCQTNRGDRTIPVAENVVSFEESSTPPCTNRGDCLLRGPDIARRLDHGYDDLFRVRFKRSNATALDAPTVCGDGKPDMGLATSVSGLVLYRCCVNSSLKSCAVVENHDCPVAVARIATGKLLGPLVPYPLGAGANLPLAPESSTTSAGASLGETPAPNTSEGSGLVDSSAVVKVMVATVAAVGIVLTAAGWIFRHRVQTRKRRRALLAETTAPGHETDDSLLTIDRVTAEGTPGKKKWQPPPASLAETLFGNEAGVPSLVASTPSAQYSGGDELPDVSTTAGMAAIVADTTRDWVDGPSWLRPNLKTLPMIAKSRLRFIRVIGNGVHGEVWRAACGPGASSIPPAVAIKTSTSVASKTMLLREAALLTQLGHKYVSPVLGVSTGPDHAYVVLPLAKWGSLLDALQCGVLQQRPVLRYRAAIQVSGGLAHLAAAGVVHRDVSARNVLVFDPHVFKVSDLGLGLRAKGIDGAKIYYKNRPGAMPIKRMAPETINSGLFSQASDVYSFGILLYAVWTDGAEIYAGVSARGILERLSAGIRLPQPPACDTAVYNAMLACWRDDPAARPPMVEVERTFVAINGSAGAGADTSSLVGAGGDPDGASNGGVG